MNSSKDSLTDWAKHEFQFDEDDLKVNRQGRMSNKQKIRALRGGTTLFIIALVSGILILAILISVDLVKGKPYNVIFDTLQGIIVFGLMGIFAWMGWRSRKAGKSGVVRFTTGRVRFRQEKERWYLCIGDEIEIEVDKKAQELFSPDLEYRFYFSVMDKTILSIEMV